jgi:hypothetical protein
LQALSADGGLQLAVNQDFNPKVAGSIPARPIFLFEQIRYDL